MRVHSADIGRILNKLPFTPLYSPQAFCDLSPVVALFLPFNTITLDFIVGLPNSAQGNNVCLTVTCRSSKAIQVIADKATDNSEVWAERLLDRPSIVSWGLPRQIIGDRDPKFIKALWRRLWEKLSAKLLLGATWYPQSDDQSERTDQTIEIMMRLQPMILATPMGKTPCHH